GENLPFLFSYFRTRFPPVTATCFPAPSEPIFVLRSRGAPTEGIPRQRRPACVSRGRNRRARTRAAAATLVSNDPSERKTRGRALARLIVALLTCAAGAGAARSESPRKVLAAGPPLESQVKAAFVYNFARFVEWPSEALDPPGSPLTICVLGDDVMR